MCLPLYWLLCLYNKLKHGIASWFLLTGIWKNVFSDCITELHIYLNRFYSSLAYCRALATLFGNGAWANEIGKINCVLTKIGKFDIVFMYDISIASLIPIIKLTLKRLGLQLWTFFEIFYFLFKLFVKVELSYVFTINLFTLANNCTESVLSYKTGVFFSCW